VDRGVQATGVVELNNIASPVQDIRATFDLMPTETTEDWQNIAARLSQVESALAGYRGRLELALSQGQAPAQRQVDACITQATAAANDFFPNCISSADGIAQKLHTELERSTSRAP